MSLAKHLGLDPLALFFPTTVVTVAVDLLARIVVEVSLNLGLDASRARSFTAPFCARVAAERRDETLFVQVVGPAFLAVLKLRDAFAEGYVRSP